MIRDYKYKKTEKAMTELSYKSVQNHLQSIFGEFAGWAQSILFISDLTSFQDENVDKINSKKRKNVEE